MSDNRVYGDPPAWFRAEQRRLERLAAPARAAERRRAEAEKCATERREVARIKADIARRRANLPYPSAPTSPAVTGISAPDTNHGHDSALNAILVQTLAGEVAGALGIVSTMPESHPLKKPLHDLLHAGDIAGVHKLLLYKSARERTSGSSPGRVTGFPIVYNVETVIRGVFREIIAVGAAANRLDVDDTLALRDHQTTRLLGRVGNGTLMLRDRSEGVHMELDLPNTDLGRETFQLVDRGDIAGGSFMLIAAKEAWYPATRGGLPLCVVKELAYLSEVTLTPIPAYSATSMKTAADLTGRAMEGRRHIVELRERYGEGSPVPPAGVRDAISQMKDARQRDFAGLEIAS